MKLSIDDDVTNTINVFKNDNFLIKRNASLVIAHIVSGFKENTIQLFLGFDQLQRNTDNMPIGEIGQSLDERGLAGARGTVNTNTKRIRNANLIIPVLVIKKVFDLVNDLVFIIEEKIVESPRTLENGFIPSFTSGFIPFDRSQSIDESLCLARHLQIGQIIMCDIINKGFDNFDTTLGGIQSNDNIGYFIGRSVRFLSRCGHLIFHISVCENLMFFGNEETIFLVDHVDTDIVFIIEFVFLNGINGAIVVSSRDNVFPNSLESFTENTGLFQFAAIESSATCDLSFELDGVCLGCHIIFKIGFPIKVVNDIRQLFGYIIGKGNHNGEKDHVENGIVSTSGFGFI